MKTEICTDEIVFKIQDYNTIVNEYDNYKFREFKDGLGIDESFERDHQQSIYETKREIKKLLTELYRNSVANNFYFFDCPLVVYRNNYKARLKAFQELNIDADEVDFLKKEIESYYDTSSHRKIENLFSVVDYSEFISNELNFEISLNKKREYLSHKLQELGWGFEQLPDETVMVGYDEYEKRSGGLSFEKIRPTTETELPKIEKPSKKDNENEVFKKVYLDVFCEQLANDKLIQDNAFCHIFELGILHFVPYLQDEIRENLINLDSSQKSLYIDIVKNKIKNTPFYNLQEASINHWLEKYKESKDNFPFFNKGKLFEDLNKFAYWKLLTEKEHLYLEDLQYDFFCYGSMLEANKMIDFIDSLSIEKITKTELSKLEKPSKKGKQLTSNQIVLFLDRLGFFNENKLKNKPKSRQSEIISLLTGLNSKNINININKLENQTSEISDNYQKDIDLVDSLFND